MYGGGHIFAHNCWIVGAKHSALNLSRSHKQTLDFIRKAKHFWFKIPERDLEFCEIVPRVNNNNKQFHHNRLPVVIPRLIPCHQEEAGCGSVPSF